MGTELTVTKGGLTVTVQEPVSGDRILRGQCAFVKPEVEKSATVELRLISRKHDHLMGPRPWQPELKIQSCRTQVKATDSGLAEFELPYPALLAPFKGKGLEIAVLLVAEASDGTTIRMMLERAPQPVGARRVLGKLPMEKTQSWPRMLPVVAFFFVATWALILAGFLTQNWQLYPGAMGTGIVFAILGGIIWKSARRWFLLGDTHVRIEGIVEMEPRLKVTVQGRGIAGGKVGLVAVEFEWTDGSSSEFKYEPLVSVEDRLLDAGAKGYQTEITVPPVDQAPPSLTLKWTDNFIQGIRWELRLDLENKRGKRAQIIIPVPVGTIHGQSVH